MLTKLTLSFVLEAEHIQEMEVLVNDEPDYSAIDAIDAPPALVVAQFSSDEDEADEDEVDISLS